MTDRLCNLFDRVGISCFRSF